MPKDIFRDRERAEEAVFAHQLDARLIEQLRARAKLSEIARALAEKLHVGNPELLRRIMELGVTLDTGAAFVLAPLVEIAWADGHVTQAEHDTVLRLAFDRGVGPGSADMAQLLKWLKDRPSTALFESALEAIKVGLSVLPHEEAEDRITKMIKACEDVAEASGGLAKLLHLHTGVSQQEASTLNVIRARLMGEHKMNTP